ncbi:MAG: hypothetical protein LBE49_01020, partial [Deltaproteobacteria bacterium]|nr:hypothetical protein [Deltaproteobacteria bacterium]
MPNHYKPAQNKKKSRNFLAAEKRAYTYLWSGAPKKRLQPPLGKKKPNPKDGPGARKEARLAVFSRKKYCQTNINLRKTRKKAAIFSRPKKGR